MGASGIAVSAVDVTSSNNTKESDILDSLSNTSSKAKDKGHNSPSASSEA
jgi:hypothetical protein